MVQKVRFYLLSDFGHVNKELIEVAKAMNRYATEFSCPPDFICGLGDNFYPHGVESVYDEQFQTIWRDTFIAPFPALRVPWRMVLGNHDYMWNPFAQIEYHYNKRVNSDQLWYMPDHCYQFQYALEKANGSEPSQEENPVKVDFFAIDTNACQNHVVHSFPQTPTLMRKYVNTFKENLSRSNAHWKIAFGHHPMYTQGLGHSGPANCLREVEYKSLRTERMHHGYGVENVVVDGKVDAYFSGHEHVFQVFRI
jgi:tartrate-resistant acid phosphatase type 5